MSLQKRNTKKDLDIFDLQLKDLELFIGLSTTLSIRELSRKTSLTPSQISKKIGKVENILGLKLFNRSTTGLSLSSAGEEILPKFKHAQKILFEIQERAEQSTQKRLVIASSSFFVSHLLPKLVRKHKDFFFDLIEIPPEDFIQVGLRSGFNTCVHTQRLDWPSTWYSEQVGEISYRLYARKNHPIFKSSSKTNNKAQNSDLENYPFVVPAYWTREGLKEGKDSFPKELKRKLGHKTSTAISAAEVLKWSDHLGFLPSLVAEGRTDLKEILSDEIKTVKQPVFLTAKSEEVSQKFYTSLAKQILAKLK